MFKFIVLIGVVVEYINSFSLGPCGCDDFEETACIKASNDCFWSSSCKPISKRTCGDFTKEADCTYKGDGDKKQKCTWDSEGDGSCIDFDCAKEPGTDDGCQGYNWSNKCSLDRSTCSAVSACSDIKAQAQCTNKVGCYWTSTACADLTCDVSDNTLCGTGGALASYCYQNADDNNKCTVRTCATQGKTDSTCVKFSKLADGKDQDCQLDDGICEDAGECDSHSKEAGCPESSCKWDSTCQDLTCSNASKTQCSLNGTNSSLCQTDGDGCSEATECNQISKDNQSTYCPSNNESVCVVDGDTCKEIDCSTLTDAQCAANPVCTMKSNTCTGCAPPASDNANLLFAFFSVVFIIFTLY